MGNIGKGNAVFCVSYYIANKPMIASPYGSPLLWAVLFALLLKEFVSNA